MLTAVATTRSEQPYPCLLIADDGQVVLFTAEEIGTIVVSVDPESPLGDFSSEWDMSRFRNYRGTVTLTQS